MEQGTREWGSGKTETRSPGYGLKPKYGKGGDGEEAPRRGPQKGLRGSKILMGRELFLAAVLGIPFDDECECGCGHKEGACEGCREMCL